MRLRFLTALILLAATYSSLSAQGITQVNSFGTNPGNLNMYTYVPNGLTGSAPLVVAMHGCSQSATIYAQQTGWNKLADLHNFYVIYPEQVSSNNSSKCFNWFDATDQTKNQGEALSIKQMVDYMIANYSIDPTAICVTGLSAGAAMSSVMLATYPEIFSKGAIMAGVPYKAATSSFNAFTAMNGGISKTPSQWGDLVRNENLTYTGPFPDVAIFHGTSDFTVSITNATELIKQWTDVNGADQTVDNTISSFQGNSIVEKTVYTDSSSNPVVVYYKITGMGHAISLDTGACPQQGGMTGTYSLEKNFHSTYWSADFFGILNAPYVITGANLVVPNATNMGYTVPSNSGSTYAWTVPAGANIVSGQSTSSITVDFGTNSGYIEVVETPAGGCMADTVQLYVDVSISSVIANENVKAFVFYNNKENCITAKNINLNEVKSLDLYNALGQKVNESFMIQGNKIVFSAPLKVGIYIVSMMGADRQYTFKVMVN